MAKIRDIQEFSAYIRGLDNAFDKGTSAAVLEAGTIARVEALKNAKKQFIGRNERKLSGGLFNSIFVEFETEAKKVPSIALGTRGIPYGRIHELGGTIKPKRAKYLWTRLPEGNRDPNFRRMTPTEFIQKRIQNSERWRFIGRMAAYVNTVGKITGIFGLADKVKIPKRPYITPAAEKTTGLLPGLISKRIREEMEKR